MIVKGQGGIDSCGGSRNIWKAGRETEELRVTAMGDRGIRSKFSVSNSKKNLSGHFVLPVNHSYSP